MNEAVAASGHCDLRPRLARWRIAETPVMAEEVGGEALRGHEMNGGRRLAGLRGRFLLLEFRFAGQKDGESAVRRRKLDPSLWRWFPGAITEPGGTAEGDECCGDRCESRRLCHRWIVGNRAAARGSARIAVDESGTRPG